MGVSLATFVFPTNAYTVSRLRSPYSNEQLYKDAYSEPSLLRRPDALSGYQRALEFIHNRSLRKDDDQPFSWCSGLPPREKCGIGFYLYLFSLLYFGAFFGICSVIAVGPLVLDYQGGYYGGEYEDQARYFPALGNTLSFPETCTLAKAQDIYHQLQFIQALQVIFDATYTCLFIVAILVFILWTRRIIEVHRHNHPTLADYSIKITQLTEPRIPLLAFLLESMRLTVHEIVPVRHVNRLLRHLQTFELHQNTHILQELSKYTERYNYQKHVTDTNLAFMFSTSEPGIELIEKSHSVIVVFETRQDRAIALQRFRKCWGLAWVLKVVVCWKKMLKKEREWTEELNAKWMATPNEICWENIRKKRYWLRILYYCATVVVILASAAVIFALRTQQNDIDDSDSRSQTKSEANLNHRIQSGSMKFLISITIAIVNLILPWVLNNIITYNERQSTIPRQKLSAMLKIFFSVLINTSFVILVVNANFKDFKVSVVLRMIDSRFEDYSRDWYLEVGFSIMLSMVICIFSPHVFWCVYYWGKMKCLKRMMTLFDTQLSYNHWAIGRDIDLPLAVAMQLVVIFTCFMYSGGMPLMLPICSLSMFCMYFTWIYLLRYVRQPREYSTILHTWFVNLLPWSVFIHCLFSAYMFGAENIFPSQSPSDWYAATSRPSFLPFARVDYLNFTYNSYEQRATSYCGVTFICLAAFAFLVGIASSFLQKKLAKWIGLNTKPLSTVLQEGNMQGGTSYHLHVNPNYLPFYRCVFQYEQGVDESCEEAVPMHLKSEFFPFFPR